MVLSKGLAQKLSKAPWLGVFLVALGAMFIVGAETQAKLLVGTGYLLLGAFVHLELALHKRVTPLRWLEALVALLAVAGASAMLAAVAVKWL